MTKLWVSIQEVPSHPLVWQETLKNKSPMRSLTSEDKVKVDKTVNWHSSLRLDGIDHLRSFSTKSSIIPRSICGFQGGLCRPHLKEDEKSVWKYSKVVVLAGLTGSLIDKIQTYCGAAIQNNLGIMQNVVWAIHYYLHRGNQWITDPTTQTLSCWCLIMVSLPIRCRRWHKVLRPVLVFTSYLRHRVTIPVYPSQ